MGPEPDEAKLTLRPATFAEAAAMEGYKEAIKGALSAADSTADKVVTASFSIATAYGALLALVAPEGDPQAVVLALPFAGLAVAVVLAMLAQSKGVAVQGTNVVAEVEGRVQSTVDAKRKLTRVAVFALAIALVVAGVLVAQNFGASGGESDKAIVALSDKGREAVTELCDTAGESTIEAFVDLEDLGDDFVELHLAKTTCLSEPTTIELPAAAILGVQPEE